MSCSNRAGIFVFVIAAITVLNSWWLWLSTDESKFKANSRTHEIKTKFISSIKNTYNLSIPEAELTVPVAPKKIHSQQALQKVIVEADHTSINMRNAQSNTKKHRSRDLSNCAVPIGFPQQPPGTKRLTNICSNLIRFRVFCNLTQQKCKECIPPWGGVSWIKDMTRFLQQSEKQTRKSRRNELKHLIENQLKLPTQNTPIVLITLNEGYGYLFMNWVCGLELQNIAQDIRKTTIIIATDAGSEQLAKKLDFSVVRGDWIQKFKIDTKAAKQFSRGAHRWTVSLQIVYAMDVVALGYDILQQDVDVVWLKDVRKYFVENEQSLFTDIEMTSDGRVDYKGPGNSGFVKVLSNCKTKIFLQTLFHYIGVVLWGSSDQFAWNMFLMEYDFRQISFSLLPPTKFVNGHQFGLHKKQTKQQVSNDVWFLHASWTDQHTKKVTKFKVMNAWFLNESCSHYQDGVVPEHKEPKFTLSEENMRWTYPDPEEVRWWAKD